MGGVCNSSKHEPIKENKDLFNDLNRPENQQNQNISKSLKIVNPNLEKHLSDENYISKYSKSINLSQNQNCAFIKEKINELVKAQPNYNIPIDQVRLYEERSKLIGYKLIPSFITNILKNNTKYLNLIVDAIHHFLNEMKNTFQKSDIAILLTNLFLLIPANNDEAVYKKEKLTIIIYFLEKYSLTKLEDYQINIKNLKKTITSISYIILDFMLNVLLQIVIMENPTKFNADKLNNLNQKEKIQDRSKLTELIIDILIDAKVFDGFKNSNEAFNCILASLVKFLCQPLKETSKLFLTL